MMGTNIDTAQQERLDAGPPDAAASVEVAADRFLRELLRPENKERLERYRHSGSSNRVYRIPLADMGIEDAGWQFVIVKLLPSRFSDMRRRVKRMLRNVLYAEHDPSLGRQRARTEIERVKEWALEGLPVPQVIDTSLADVRVFRGLPFPTFYTVLTDPDIPVEKKLEAVGLVTRALEYQHQLAFLRLKKSLVHRDAGPWNIMVDLKGGEVYWFDLEHPAEYPSMTLEDLIVRAFRIYLHGVLVYLRGHEGEVIRIVVDNYTLKPIIRGYVRSMEKHRRSLTYQAIGRVKKSTSSKLVERGIVDRVRTVLESAGGIAKQRVA